MTLPLIERVARDAQRLDLDPAASYLRSYPEFLRYFREIPVIEEHHGKVPISDGVDTLNRARSGALVSDDDVTKLAQLINNSIVGASKLLHFVSPERFAIWDSRVARYLHGPITAYRLNRTRVYRAYLTACAETVADPAFAAVHDRINEQVGYPVTPLRAVELVMYAAPDA